MDASVESFIRYRLERFTEISEKLNGFNTENHIPTICDYLKQFALDRPNFPFFREAKGTRFVRSDLKYFFPATLGIDIRPYLKGQHLKFHEAKWEAEKTIWTPEVRHTMMALARLLFLLDTFNLHLLDIRPVLEEQPSLRLYGMRSSEHRFAVIDIALHYLAQIQGIPIKAKSLIIDDQHLRSQVNMGIAHDVMKATLQLLKEGEQSITLSLLENQFETFCNDFALNLHEDTLSIDPALSLVVDMKKLSDFPLPDGDFLKLLEYRYHHTSYLFAAQLYQEQQKKITALETELTKNLEETEHSLEHQDIHQLSCFLLGESVFQQNSFYFEGYENHKVGWKKIERRAAYLGESSKIEKGLGGFAIPPHKIPLNPNIRSVSKRPVCLLLDISGSMKDCFDIALSALEALFAKLEGHPILVVLFSEITGVLNRGQPIVSKGKPLKEELDWIYSMVKTAYQYSGLGLATSIGNAFLQATALSLNTSKQMKAYTHWKATGVVAHCVLLSDNFQNTPRDVSTYMVGKGYVLNTSRNVALFAAKEGYSLHNLVCCDPPLDYSASNDSKYSLGEMAVDLRNSHFKSAVNAGFWETPENGISHEKRIRRRLYVADEVILSKIKKNNSSSNRSGKYDEEMRKQAYVEYRGDQTDNEKGFSVLNLPQEFILEEGKTMGSTTLDIPALTTFIYYVRNVLQYDFILRQSLSGLCQEFDLTLDDFLQEPVILHKIDPLYNHMKRKQWIEFHHYESQKLDAPLFISHELSQFIDRSQQNIHALETTPLFLTIPEPPPKGHYRLTKQGLSDTIQRLKSTKESKFLRFLLKHLEPFLDKVFDTAAAMEDAILPVLDKHQVGFAMPFIISESFEKSEFADEAWFGQRNLQAIHEAVDQVVKQIQMADSLSIQKSQDSKFSSDGVRQEVVGVE